MLLRLSGEPEPSGLLVLIEQVCGGAHESAFLTSSQALWLLPVHRLVRPGRTLVPETSRVWADAPAVCLQGNWSGWAAPVELPASEHVSQNPMLES